MPLRAKIILSIIIGIVGIIVVVGVVLGVNSFLNRPASTNTETPQTGSQQEGDGQPTDGNQLPSLTGTTSPTPVPPPTPPAQLTATQDTIITMSMSFVERLGTYSNQSNFDNLTALMPFMTETMKSWAQGKIDAANKEPFNSLYTGITTKALSYTIVSLNDGQFDASAELKITTQRKESVGSPANAKVYNQDAVVKLVRQGDVWLVDSATWQ